MYALQFSEDSAWHVARHTLMYSIESFTSTSEWRDTHLGGRIVCRAHLDVKDSISEDSAWHLARHTRCLLHAARHALFTSRPLHLDVLQCVLQCGYIWMWCSVCCSVVTSGCGAVCVAVWLHLDVLQCVLQCGYIWMWCSVCCSVVTSGCGAVCVAVWLHLDVLQCVLQCRYIWMCCSVCCSVVTSECTISQLQWHPDEQLDPVVGIYVIIILEMTTISQSCNDNLTKVDGMTFWVGPTTWCKTLNLLYTMAKVLTFQFGASLLLFYTPLYLKH